MPNEALLVDTLVRLAECLVEDFDIVDVLTLLSDRCVEALDVDSAGVMLASPAGRLQVVASSSDEMRVLELFQLQSDEGPCIDCYRTGEPIVNLDLTGLDDRWPHFAPRAVAAGFRSVHSLPMHLRGRTIGALNMFRTDNGSLAGDDVLAAQALADVATVAVQQHQSTVNAQEVNDQLNLALNNRVIVEQAKGRISEASQLTMSDAFQRLLEHARRHGMLLTSLASDIVSGAVAPTSLDNLP